MERNGSFIVFDRAHGSWVVASTVGRHSQRDRAYRETLGSEPKDDRQRAQGPADRLSGHRVASKRLATSSMAVMGRLILSVAFLIVGAVIGWGAWAFPILLHGVEENDLAGMLVWTFGFLFLVIMAGASFVCAIGVWTQE